MRMILQSEASECGLACLAMIDSAHGGPGDLFELRQRFNLGSQGIGLRQLMDCGSAIGFTCRPVRLEIAQFARLRLPCILHWDMNHFVVLHSVGRRHIVIMDPAVGRRRLSMEEVSAHFTGVALELAARPEYLRREQLPALKLRQLSGRVSGLTRSLILIFLVALALEIFAILAPLFNQLVVDEAIVSGDRDLLSVLALGFGLLMVVQTAISLVRSWMVVVLGQTIGFQWQANLFQHLLRLPVSFFERRHLGDIASRFGSIHAIQQILTNRSIEAVLDGMMACAALILMVIYAPFLAFISTIAVLIYGGIQALSYSQLRNAAAERLVLSAKENSHFLESIRSISPLKLFGREGDRGARWQDLVLAVQNRDARTAKIHIAVQSLHSLIMGTENIVVFWMGAKLVIGEDMDQSSTVFTLGMLLAFVSYKNQFVGRLSALFDFIVEWRMLRLHGERLADIALTPPEPSLQALDSVEESQLLPASITLSNVSFRYSESQPWILKDVSMHVASGESVAIIGSSGAGKTTLIKLLVGLLAPTEGEIFYGGIPARTVGLTQVRRQMGTVMQDDLLLTGTIYENITCFDLHGEPERVERSAKLAGIHEVIIRMPMGYRTMIGEAGSGLSGGQRQRLMLARALYKNPKLLVLDEATSHLDHQSERAVAGTLRSLAITRIVVAHRPATIREAKKVWRLVDGSLIRVTKDQASSCEPSRTP